MKSVVLFFRGMNTYGDEDVHLGPVRLGPMYRHLSQAFSNQGLQLIPVLGMRRGKVTEHVERAVEYVQKLGAVNPGELRFHLLGHSMGGVIARAFAHHYPEKERILSVTTLATPHLGATTASHVQDFIQRRPLTYQALKITGYDMQKKLQFYEDLEPENMSSFNSRYPNLPHVKYASMVFSLPTPQMSWLMQLVKNAGPAAAMKEMGDGLIEARSQEWGEVLARLELDHLSQLGFNVHIQPQFRRQTQRHFISLCEHLTTFWRRF